MEPPERRCTHKQGENEGKTITDSRKGVTIEKRKKTKIVRIIEDLLPVEEQSILHIALSLLFNPFRNSPLEEPSLVL
jgi:hypothetical protein